MNYHLRSNSGSNGPIAKECHRFLVAGPFNFALSPGSGNRISWSGVLPNQTIVISQRHRPHVSIGYIGPKRLPADGVGAIMNRRLALLFCLIALVLGRLSIRDRHRRRRSWLRRRPPCRRRLLPKLKAARSSSSRSETSPPSNFSRWFGSIVKSTNSGLRC